MVSTAVTPPAAPQPEMPPVTVYYDGACPLCAREIAVYRRQAGAEGVCWVDVSSEASETLPDGLTRSAALARFHVRGADGKLRSGAAAFLSLWHSLPRFARAARLLDRPVPRAILESGYRLTLIIRPALQALARRVFRPHPQEQDR